MSNQQLKYSPKKCKHLKPIPKPTFQFFPPTTFSTHYPMYFKEYFKTLYVLPFALLKDSLKVCTYFNIQFLLSTIQFHPHLIYCIVASFNTHY